MRSIRLLRASSVAGALALAGCGKSTTEAKPLAASPPTTAPAAVVEVAKVAPPTTAATPAPPEAPRPAFVFGGVVPPPVPVAQTPVPAPAPQPPVPVPVPQPPVPVPQPPAPEPKPAPTPTPDTPPGAASTTPKPIEYPKLIEGRDLATWLKDLAYNSTTTAPVQTDPQTREVAIKVLPGFGPSARRPALNPLIAVVNYDPDPGVRQAAILVISNMGYEEDAKERGTPMAKVAVGPIQLRLAKTAPGSAERLTCVRTLASLGSDAVGSVKSLRDVCRDPSYETRIAIANALGRVGAAKDEHGEANKDAAMTLLEFLLVDACSSVRMEAIQSLLVLGPPRLKDNNVADYVKAVEPYQKAVAARLKPDAGKPGEKDKNVVCWLLLLQIMYDGNTLGENVRQLAQFVKAPAGLYAANLRMNAMNALAVLGPKALPAVDTIIEALLYEDPYLVAAAISCLAPMGTGAVKAIPHLEAIAAGSKDPERPKDAPKEWKPDQTLRAMAKEAIEYVKGNKKVGVPEPKEAPKP